MERVQYARSGDAWIAYHAEGEGPGLVYLGNWGTNMEALDGTLEFRSMATRLAASARFVMMDQRGTGLSEGDASVDDIGVWVEDVEAVLDAVGLASAVLIGHDLAAPVVPGPERTAALRARR